MDDKISSCIRNLDHEWQNIRINAINELGEIGDELCLKELTERLKILTLEHKALVIAVAKLKKKFGIV
jgi:hypothetical protein